MIIYKATNIQNNKVYIGQTVGLLKNRINGHISESKRNVQNNKFHNAILKYGVDSFRWEIIDKANSKDELNKLEIFYINLYNSTKDEYGYNTQLGGNLSSSKKVINLTNGDVYMSATEAERILKKINNKISVYNICAVCRGDKFHHYGFIFKYEQDTENVREKYIEKTYFVKDLNTNTIYEYPNLQTIERFLKLPYHKLRYHMNTQNRPIQIENYVIFKDKSRYNKVLKPEYRKNSSIFIVEGIDEYVYSFKELSKIFGLKTYANLATKFRKTNKNYIYYKNRKIIKLK